MFILPAFTLLTGVGLAQLAAGQARPLRPDVVIALVAAVLGPLATMLVLSTVYPRFDWILVATAAMLTAIGTTTLHSLSLMGGADGAFYQAISHPPWLLRVCWIPGADSGRVLSRHLDQIRRYPFTLLGIAFMLTVATVIFGRTVNGARLWLAVGPVQFQPSEVARLLLAGFAAAYLYDRRHLVVAPWRIGSFDLPPAPYLLPLAGAVLAAVAVLVFRNDLGMAALVVLGTYALVASVLSSKSSLASAGAILMLAAVVSLTVAPRCVTALPRGSSPGTIRPEEVFSLSSQSTLSRPAVSSARAARPWPGACPRFRPTSSWRGLPRSKASRALAVLGLTSIMVCRCVAAALHTTDGFAPCWRWPLPPCPAFRCF